MLWRGGWRVTLFATAVAGGLSLLGAKTLNARQAARRAVRVQTRQLKQWYRTLDRLLAGKERIEHGLFVQLRDLWCSTI
jgi:hypothetical protein